jgi:uncharacterized damage-inducible protein DinB
MYTVAALLDVHERTHRSLAKLLDHCAGFSEEQFDQELEGFSYPSIRLQLHHLLGAERYWLGVLQGEMVIDDDAAEHATVDALRALREAVSSGTAAYLHGATDASVNAPATFKTWHAEGVQLVPAHVLLRTQVHVYQHQGEIASMSRLLGRPFPQGLDFPLT